MICKSFIPVFFVSLSLLSCSEPINHANMEVSEIDTLVMSVDLNPYKIAPLSAILHLYSTTPVSLTITVKGKYQDNIVYNIRDCKSSHVIPVIGLYPDYKNELIVTSINAEQAITDEQSLFIQTAPVSIELPVVEIIVPAAEGAFSDLYFVEYRSEFNVPFVIDNHGEIRWYLDIRDMGREPFVSDQHNIIYSSSSYKNYYFRYDWTGKADSVSLPPLFKSLHHNFSFGEKSFFVPAEGTDGANYIAEFDYQGNLVKSWDINKIVKKYLPNVQTLVYPYNDWLHINSVIPSFDLTSLIVSSRQNIGLMKIDYKSGDIQWIMGDTGRTWYDYPELRKLALLAENNSEFPLGQHSPVLTEDGQLLILDNGFEGYGNNRDGMVNGGRGYSRIARFSVDEGNQTFDQVMEYGKERGIELYSCLGGNVSIDPLTGNYIALFGMITGTDPGLPENTRGRIVEVSAAGDLLFEAKLTASDPSQLFYRVEKLEIGNLIN
jgi:hypothetical protein